MSGQATCNVTTDAGQNNVDLRLTPRLSVLANGSGFEFYLPKLDQASIAVYDVLGRLVTTVYSEPAAVGWHEVTWDWRGRSGRVASGVYFARLYTNLGRPVTEKFVFVH